MNVVELPPRLYGAAIELWHGAGLTRPWNNPRDDLLRAIQGAESTVLACVDGERLLGTAMVGHDGHRGWVYYLAVHDEHRASGFGRRLMRACEAWVAARQIAVLREWCAKTRLLCCPSTIGSAMNGRTSRSLDAVSTASEEAGGEPAARPDQPIPGSWKFGPVRTLRTARRWQVTGFRHSLMWP